MSKRNIVCLLKNSGINYLLVFWMFLMMKNIYSQNEPTVVETDLKSLSSSFLSKESNEAKNLKNTHFKEKLQAYLQDKESLNQEFKSLNNISSIWAPDKSFRIFTWTIRYDDGHYTNFGLVQIPDKKGNITVSELVDKSEDIKNPETKNLGSKSWFGAVYYQIIPQPIGNKGRYAVLGINAHNSLSKVKVIDIIEVDATGHVKFGAPVFVTPKKTFNRIVMEYNADATVSLKYDSKNNQIVFDHISPSSPSVVGQYQFYGPDFSVDAFKIKKGKLVFQQDIDARNTTENKGNATVKPENGLKK
jgi:hypothetical protein